MARAKKIKGYAQGGYVLDPSGKPQLVMDVNNIPPGSTLINPNDYASYGLKEPTQHSNIAGQAVGGLVGVTAGAVAGGALGTLVGMPVLGSKIGMKVGADKGRRKGIEFQNKKRNELANGLVKPITENASPQGGGGSLGSGNATNTPLNEIEGSAVLAQNIEDEFLKRKADEEEILSSGMSDTEAEFKGTALEGTRRAEMLGETNQTLDKIPLVGQINRLGQGLFGKSIAKQRAKWEATDESGKVIRPGRAKMSLVAGSMLNPLLGHQTRRELDSWGTSFGKDYVDAIENREGFADGGYKTKGGKGGTKGGQIEGKGTGKSDSIEANLPHGSFIVPAENNAIAIELREKFLSEQGDKKAKLNKSNPEDKVSNGEHIFTPDEVSILEQNGINLSILAPNSKHDMKNEYKDGGNVSKLKIGDRGSVEIEVYESKDKSKPFVPVKPFKNEKEKEAFMDYEKRRLETVAKTTKDATTKKNAENAIAEITYNKDSYLKSIDKERDVQEKIKTENQKIAEERVIKQVDNLSKLQKERGYVDPLNPFAPPMDKRTNEDLNSSSALAQQIPFKESYETYGEGSKDRNKELEAVKKIAKVEQKNIDKTPVETQTAIAEELSKGEGLTRDEINAEISGEQDFNNEQALDDSSDKTRKERRKERKENREPRDIDSGKTFQNVLKGAELGLGVYQTLKAEKELRELGPEPRLGITPELRSLHDRLARESTYGISEGAKSALRGSADDGLRNVYRSLEESGMSQGSQLANKLAATIKTGEGAGRNIALTDEQSRLTKLGMMPGVTGMIQNVRTQDDLQRLQSRRSLELALGQMQQTGISNIHNFRKYDELMRERELRKEYENRGIGAETTAAIYK